MQKINFSECIYTVKMYSGAHLIRMANAWKNIANYLSMWIIRAYFTLHFNQQQRVVSKASVRIKRRMWISEGQIIRATRKCTMRTSCNACITVPLHCNALNNWFQGRNVISFGKFDESIQSR